MLKYSILLRWASLFAVFRLAANTYMDYLTLVKKLCLNSLVSLIWPDMITNGRGWIIMFGMSNLILYITTHILWNVCLCQGTNQLYTINCPFWNKLFLFFYTICDKLSLSRYNLHNKLHSKQFQLLPFHNYIIKHLLISCLLNPKLCILKRKHFLLLFYTQIIFFCFY